MAGMRQSKIFPALKDITVAAGFNCQLMNIFYMHFDSRADAVTFKETLSMFKNLSVNKGDKLHKDVVDIMDNLISVDYKFGILPVVYDTGGNPIEGDHDVGYHEIKMQFNSPWDARDLWQILQFVMQFN